MPKILPHWKDRLSPLLRKSGLKPRQETANQKLVWSLGKNYFGPTAPMK